MISSQIAIFLREFLTAKLELVNFIIAGIVLGAWKKYEVTENN